MPQTRTLDKMVRRSSYLVIGAVAAVFSLFAFHTVDPRVNLGHFLRHLGVGMTIFASFMAAYEFTRFQGKYVERWFHGTNLTILILTMLLCTLAMSSDQNVFWHTMYVHLSLGLYIIWDLIAIWYYKRRSTTGYHSYMILRNFDIAVFAAYVFAYVPPATLVSREVIDAMSATNAEHAFSDFLAGVILILEFFGFLLIRPTIMPVRARQERLSVYDGYAAVADYYDAGNPIMLVEKRHTSERLQHLNINGEIVDLGCGTGRYVGDLLTKANKVYAIDASQEMLEKLKTKYQDPKLEIVNREVDLALGGLAQGSIQGIFCSLVLDHLTDDRLQATFRASYNALTAGGWLYITDVNPYYEELEHPYAEFVNERGEGTRITVYPHHVSEVRKHLKNAGFNQWTLTEVRVTNADANGSDELVDLINQPLIFEYYASK